MTSAPADGAQGRAAGAVDGFDAYWAAVTHGDPDAALATARDRAAAGVPVAQVLESLVVASQRRVGELWATGEWTITQEHAATAVSESVVRSLLAEVEDTRARARDAREPDLLVACAEKEWHALPTLVLTTALVAAGHGVVHLGGDVSTRALQAHLLDVPARALLVSASLASSLLHVRRHLETATASGVPVVVGGRAFDPAGRRARALGATAQALSVEALLDLLPGLPPYVVPTGPLDGPAQLEALMVAAEAPAMARSLMARVLAAGAAGDTPLSDEERHHLRTTLADQLPLVVGSLVGALLTDDPSVLHETLDWLGLVATSRQGDPNLPERVVHALRSELRDFPCALATVSAS